MRFLLLHPARTQAAASLPPFRQTGGLSLALLILVAGFTSGCWGPSDGLVSASGRVTYNDRPLPIGTVTLYQNGASRGMGAIHDGHVEVHQSTDITGVQPGEYQVAVTCWEEDPHTVQDDGSIGGPGVSLIPEKYTSATTSGLTVRIGAAEPFFVLELSSE